MAEESVAEVQDPPAEPKRKGRFGRRKETPSEVRTETEWVDTLSTQGEGQMPARSLSPFAADAPDETAQLPEFTPPAPEPEPRAAWTHGGPLPPEARITGDEVVVTERQLARPEKRALENQVRAGHAHRGDTDEFYEKGWNRRSPESIDDIHSFIDNVIGTNLDPLHRHSVLRASGVSAAKAAGAVTVEGLPGHLTIAFSFPPQEFRGARVVYETEGGYVVEVVRAVGGRDDQRETQHYTVSRVGDVAHVIDRMRSERSPLAGRSQEPADEAPAAPEPRAAPAPARTDTAAAPAAAPAPQGQDPLGSLIAGAEPASEGDKRSRFGGLSGRFKRQDEPAPAPEAAPADDAEKKGRFSGIAGRFRKKGGEEGEETA